MLPATHLSDCMYGPEQVIGIEFGWRATHLDRRNIVRIYFQNLSSICPEMTLRFHHLSFKTLNLPNEDIVLRGSSR